MATAVCLAACSEAPPARPDAAPGEDSGGRARAEAFYQSRPKEEQPKAGWQRPPEGLADLRAARCGECHQAIYQEWQVSTHSQAWTDRQFQAEIRKSGNRWLCNNCHTPLLNQMERWAVGLEGDDVERPRYVPNPDFDPAFRDEGITCAACHVRAGAVEGPTGVETDAHPTRRAARFLDETLCTACHQALRRYPGKDFECTFDTGREWLEGPFSKAKLPCQHCHMQPITRPTTEDSPPRVGRRHFWPGAGIYKVAGRGPPLDQLAPGLLVKIEPGPEGLGIALSNGAGHRLPTGDPERFITVDWRFLDAGGAEVGRHQERIGQRWVWHPSPKKLSDNRLASGEVRTSRLPRPKGATRWQMVARSHRMTPETQAYHHLEGYPISRETQRAEGGFPERGAAASPDPGIRPAGGP